MSFDSAYNNYSVILSARIFKMLILKNLLYPDTVNEFYNTIKLL